MYTGDDNLFTGAGLAGDVAAPLELAVARGLHLHLLPLHAQPATVAHFRAFSRHFLRIFSVRIHNAGSALNPTVAGGSVLSAVVGRGLEEHKLPLLDRLGNPGSIHTLPQDPVGG